MINNGTVKTNFIYHGTCAKNNFYKVSLQPAKL
jgi:hypothetical protein